MSPPSVEDVHQLFKTGHQVRYVYKSTIKTELGSSSAQVTTQS